MLPVSDMLTTEEEEHIQRPFCERVYEARIAAKRTNSNSPLLREYEIICKKNSALIRKPSSFQKPSSATLLRTKPGYADAINLKYLLIARRVEEFSLWVKEETTI